MNPALVNEAVQIAIAAETEGPKDLTLFLHNSFSKEPYNTIVGPMERARWRERPHHAERLHRCRVGRSEACRHHQ